MTTTIRPEVSEKNKYWIERHRYYELKHFCMQYEYLKEKLLELDGKSFNPQSVRSNSTSSTSDPTAACALERISYSNRIELINRAAIETDQEIGGYILIGVTTGMSYDILNAKYNVPCCKDIYYNLYRRFFWILDKIRG